MSMFTKYVQSIMAVHNSLCRQQPRILSYLNHMKRTGPGYCGIHGTAAACSKTRPEISSEPVKFTTSPANITSKIQFIDANKYQGVVVIVSLSVFMIYFCFLREENDIDEMLNVQLFERVPELEEPVIVQAIPHMKERGIDTHEAEARLKELVDKKHHQKRTD